MKKSSDLEIIKQLEKELGVTLKRVEMGEFEKITIWKFGDYGIRVLQAYTLDEQGRVKGLSLVNLQFSNIQMQLISLLHFLEHVIIVGTGFNDYSSLSSLAQLTSLDLVANNLSDVSVLSSLTQLTSLNLAANNLNDVSFLSSLTQLTSLNLEANNLNDVSFLSSLTQLTFLNLSWNKEIKDYSFLSSLKQLTFLDLNNNNLSDVSFLSSLTQLTSLNLGWNQSIKDHSFLSSMTQLTSLNLDKNKSIKDYSFLSSLTQLTSLDLAANDLTDVSFLSSLTQLTSLNLGYNSLSDVSFLSSLTQLTSLNLRENPITNPPPEIVEKGIEAIRNFFKQLEDQGKARLYEARLLLVGEPVAGKTTLLKKITIPDYPVPNKEEESTLGIEINSDWDFAYSHDKKITFKTNIWDFGGQPIQYMLHQYFLTSRSLYVLVSDDREQRTNFDYWFDIIKVLGEQSPVLVVLNEKKHRSISNFDYDKYQKRYSSSYDIEKRDVDFSKNDGRFKALVNKIQDMLSNLKHIGDELPRQWVPVRKELEGIKNENQISINRYFDVCRKHGINDEPDMLNLCGYLTSLGVVLHYKDDCTLEDTIFVNPYWIVDALYTAISDKTLEKNKGRFKKEWLFKLWEQKGYTYDERCKLLNLMLKDNFEICYRVAKERGKKEEYMVPMLLPDVEPDYTPLPETNCLKFRFQYPFMPEGIISRLIVRLHEDIEKQEKKDLIWKKGFILNREGIRVRVAEERSEKGLQIIDIKVSGEEGRRRDFLVVIKNEIHNIHKKSFKDIDYEEMVPCTCSRCIEAKIPYYYEFSVLERYLEAGEGFIKCALSVESVGIWELIEIIVPRKSAYGSHRGLLRLPRGLNKAVSPEQPPQEDEKIKQIKDIDEKIEKIQKQLRPEEDKKTVCDQMAERKADHSIWWLVGFSVIVLAILAVLIFVIYDWDTMEPWTYLSGFFLMVVNLIYFAIRKRKLDSKEFRDRRLEKEKQKLYPKYGVDMDIINRLQSELQELESRKKELLNVPSNN
ncbi:MAG: COR domain-containing protein [Candidatus Aminicenantes bacterium]|jgi:Leucine-rich repeat (LRR) protein